MAHSQDPKPAPHGSLELVEIKPGFHFRKAIALMPRRFRAEMLEQLREKIRKLDPPLPEISIGVTEVRGVNPHPFLKALGFAYDSALEAKSKDGDHPGHDDHEEIEEAVDRLLEDVLGVKKNFSVVDGGFQEESCSPCGPKWCGSKALAILKDEDYEPLSIELKGEFVPHGSKSGKPRTVRCRVPVCLFVKWTVGPAAATR